MFCDFNSIFHPTYEQSLQQTTFLCKIAKEAIEHHSCNACKYADIKKDYEMGYGVYDVYCSLDGSLKCDYIQDNCNKWELSDISNNLYKILKESLYNKIERKDNK